MIGAMVEQFIQSPAARESIQEIATKVGISEPQAEDAVKATAEGAAEASTGEGLAGMATSLLGGGGGGLAGMAGSLLGGGSASLPTELVGKVSAFVAEKTGIPAATAQSVVEMALPKVLAFVKG